MDKMDGKVSRIRMKGNALQWVGADLDNEANRRKFIRFLKGWHNEMTTPYWACNRCALVADCERMTALLAKGRK